MNDPTDSQSLIETKRGIDTRRVEIQARMYAAQHEYDQTHSRKARENLLTVEAEWLKLRAEMIDEAARRAQMRQIS